MYSNILQCYQVFCKVYTTWEYGVSEAVFNYGFFLFLFLTKGNYSDTQFISMWNSRFVKSKTSVAILEPKICL